MVDMLYFLCPLRRPTLKHDCPSPSAVPLQSSVVGAWGAWEHDWAFLRRVSASVSRASL